MNDDMGYDKWFWEEKIKKSRYYQVIFGFICWLGFLMIGDVSKMGWKWFENGL